jgi:trehalose 6-phosphate synthase
MMFPYRSANISPAERHKECDQTQKQFLDNKNLIIVSNRGPVTFQTDDEGEVQVQRGGGGLVTALAGMAQHVQATWVACAMTDEDRDWGSGEINLNGENNNIRVNFIVPDDDAYDGYYNVIANPLLWFLQHSMWDMVRSPTINHATWRAWENGYMVVNDQFAEVISEEIKKDSRPALVMLQDYHLYLTPQYLREKLDPETDVKLIFFTHIPWPGPEDWGMLPPKMRRGILEGLCAADLLGFQTREDGLNFIRTVETHLPGSEATFKHGRIWYENHATYVRDFPISIDVEALRLKVEEEEVKDYYRQLNSTYGTRQLILRIDRTEPSKNIVRGFQAFDELLELYPEHLGTVQFLALLVPSRMEVAEYQDYLDELMAAAGRVNVRHGDSEWEPVRVLVGENFPRAVAAMQLYDVLLVNSVADGMNLVAKEGPTVNKKDGVVILSEKTGARQQLEPGALVISPCDIYATAEAFHQALTMDGSEKSERSIRLKNIVERADIKDWLCRQIEMMNELNI